jgi:hypothetical protein
MGLRKQPAVLRFVGVARKYCAIINSPVSDREAWIEHVLSALAALYSAALGLPHVALTTDDVEVPDNLRSDVVQWQGLWTRLGEILGEARYHWAYFDPTEPRDTKEKPMIHDLADDLSDIYRDVEVGLRAWDSNVESWVAHTMWEWRCNFQNHWGAHAVSALRALHQLVFYRGLGTTAPTRNHV